MVSPRTLRDRRERSVANNKDFMMMDVGRSNKGFVGLTLTFKWLGSGDLEDVITAITALFLFRVRAQQQSHFKKKVGDQHSTRNFKKAS